MTLLALIRGGVVAVLVAVGAVAAWALLRWRAERYPPELVRTNVNGLPVPVVLGDALVGGSLCALAVLFVIDLIVKASFEVPGAVLVVLVVMWGAGAWDDRKGNERPRGFAGHLGALRSRTVTGGVVKIAAGIAAGAGAAALLPARDASPGAHVIETIGLVALTANCINLLDRAPGRASKAALVIGVPLALTGELHWAVAATPVLGAVLFCLGPDLRERAMLGDAGSNPLGAVLGVGLVASLGETGRAIAIVVLLLLNLASERWSFSRVIDATAPLRWLDGLGRKDHGASK